jgi:hypothetical protein
VIFLSGTLWGSFADWTQKAFTYDSFCADIGKGFGTYL